MRLWCWGWVLGLLLMNESHAAEPLEHARFASFNIAMGLSSEGELAAALASDQDERLQKVAALIQKQRPDVLLLNEFDYDASIDAAQLFQRHYLAVSQRGQAPIHYAFHFRAPVNTGVPSGLDINHDQGEAYAENAWGYGTFPGQYGMLVLSRFPIQEERVRTFQFFRWSAMPGALRPRYEDGASYWSDAVWSQLRLSSKSHWDLPIVLPDGRIVHFLVSHPTPPVFDGPENRNGLRNHDEIRFWADYVSADGAAYHLDDQGRRAKLPAQASWVLAGDLNADPQDGDSVPGTMDRLLDPGLSAACEPVSDGAPVAAKQGGGANLKHRGDSRFDTADFNNRYTGNLRVDYVLASATEAVVGCGVLWPAPGEPAADWVTVSDHRLVWLDLALSSKGQHRDLAPVQAETAGHSSDE